jgi:hypothetical protein
MPTSMSRRGPYWRVRLVPFLRILYWLLIGWWATWLWLYVLWLLHVTWIGRPWARWMANAIPCVLLLANNSAGQAADEAEEIIRWRPAHGQPIATPIRLLYVSLVGWWWSLIWITLTALVMATIIGLPLGWVMLSYLPWMTHLERTQ